MRWMIVLLVLVFLFGCTQTNVELTDDTELFEQSAEQALAGQAVAGGCKVTPVDSCVANEDGSVNVSVRGRQYHLRDRCSRSVEISYSCNPEGSQVKSCKKQCATGQCDGMQCLERWCEDSDQGHNPSEQGTVRGLNFNNEEVERSDFCYIQGNQDVPVDSCDGETCLLYENGCAAVEEGLTVTADAGVQCEHGCADGACVEPPVAEAERCNTNFESYPCYFVEETDNGNGTSFTGFLVAGANAAVTDLLALTDIAASMTFNGQFVQMVGSVSMLDSEIENVTAQDIITVGSGSVNRVTGELLGYPRGCITNLEPSQVRFKLQKHSNGGNSTHSLLVYGYDDRMTRIGGQIIAHRIGEFRGDDVICTGEDWASAVCISEDVEQ